MRILNRLGGIELSQAYACIKAISKKKTEVIAQGRKQFIEGAVERGLEKERAAKIFDLIEFFGGYGFNKSHTTRLRPASPTRRPTSRPTTRPSSWPPCSRPRWTAPSARSSSSTTSTTAGGWESRSSRPTSTQGELEFQRRRGGEDPLRPGGDQGGGLQGGRGDRQGASEGRAVPAGSTTSSSACRTAVVSQACVEASIKAGAFDALGGRRSQWLAVLPAPPRPASRAQEDRKRGQRELFDVFAGPCHGNGQPDGKATRRVLRACPTSPSCPTPSAWPRRRRCSASTCRAIP